MSKGIIKTITDRGFGFITPDNGGVDIFFHFNNVDGEPKEGCEVDYIEVKKNDGKVAAEAVKITSVSKAITPPESNQASKSNGGGIVIFDSFYDGNGYLREEIFRTAAEKSANSFEDSGVKSSQLRNIYQCFLQVINNLKSKKIDFGKAKELFGDIYVEKVLRQSKRKVITNEVLEFFKNHYDLATSSEKEMVGLFKYYKYIYCYFGDSGK